MKKIPVLFLVMSVLCGVLSGCEESKQEVIADGQSVHGVEVNIREGETQIILSDEEVLVNGRKAGTKKAAVYLSNDIIYFEDKDTYESGNPYGEGKQEDRHSADEAAAHTVVNITAPGTYRLQGDFSMGQIRVDLGEDAYEDEKAAATLILDGVDINCDVAPVILFMNVYECDGEWSTDTAKAEVDTSKAGANVIIADGSVNNIEGAYVAKIFKDKEEEKKLWKQDGALYSYMSMNVNGEEEGTGVLNLTADNEGLDTELHLTINGGNINIFSQNDGINTNEDGVSVTTINGGNIHIIAGLGAEGDGVDSNGWLVINGGTVVSCAKPKSDAGLDSDMGSYVNGGTVAAFGSTMNWAESNSDQVTMNLKFAEYKEPGEAIVVMDEKEENIVFSYDPAEDEVLANYAREFMGAIISCPEFTVGDVYHVFVGEALQGYTGIDVRGGFGGGQGGFGGGMQGQMREGGFPERPGNGEMRRERKGFADGDQGEFSEMPEGEMPMIPEGEVPLMQEGEMPMMPEGEMTPMQEGEVPVDGEMRTEFFMQDKVNCFSGVSDPIED